MDWLVRGVYNRVVMVPPIAAVSFIRLLCGMCSADVALCRGCVLGKMALSECYNCVCWNMGRSKDVPRGAYGERRVVLLHVVTFTLYGQNCICRILKTHSVPRSKLSQLLKTDKLTLKSLN